MGPFQAKGEQTSFESIGVFKEHHRAVLIVRYQLPIWVRVVTLMQLAFSDDTFVHPVGVVLAVPPSLAVVSGPVTVVSAVFRRFVVAVLILSVALWLTKSCVVQSEIPDLRA